MLQIRRSGDRGASQRGSLDRRHTFSFADYHDPELTGFGPLRVINEDRVAPDRGFGTHGHRDTEIISYVLEGALEHKDCVGAGSVIRPGDVHIMSAGTGILHNEFNHSNTRPVHFLQIWVVPNRTGIAPRYQQAAFPESEKRGRLLRLASPDGRDGSLTVHQDVELRAAVLDAGQRVQHWLGPGRRAWLQVARGALRLNGQDLAAGDGAAVQSESALTLDAKHDGTEILLFDLP